MRYIIIALPLLLLTACSNRKAAEYIATADSTSLSGNVADIRSASRKVVKTADFNAKVTDVAAATHNIEQLVTNTGGIVANSNTERIETGSKSMYHTVDSVKAVHTYIQTAELTLRVPIARYDSVINALPALCSYVNHRSLKQDDQTLMYLGNALKNEVADEVLTEPASAKKQAAGVIQANQSIDRRMQNLQLLDDVNYATLTVALTQPEQVYSEVLVNTSYATRIPLSSRINEALYNGKAFLEALLVITLTLWPVWLLGVAGLLIYRRLRRHKILLPKA